MAMRGVTTRDRGYIAFVMLADTLWIFDGS